MAVQEITMGRVHISALPLLFLCITIPLSTAAADHGGMSYDPGVTFDERAQNAIIAWDGREEVLILSTDVRSAVAGRLLEFLPLPSCPRSITEGDVSSFSRITGLFYPDGTLDPAIGPPYLYGVNERYYPGIQTALHSTVGPHDITVVKVTSTESFMEWVTEFSRTNGVQPHALPHKLQSCVEGYVNRNINFFAFDVVQLSDDIRTISPLVYRFDSEFLYYPLEVTRDTLDPTGWYGHTIQLFLVTQWKPRTIEHDALKMGNMGGMCIPDKVPSSTLKHVSSDVSGLFPDGAYVSVIGQKLTGGSDVAGLRDIQLGLSDFLDLPQMIQYKLAIMVKDLSTLPSIASVMAGMEQDELGPFLLAVIGGMLLFSLLIGLSLVRLFKRLRPGWNVSRLVTWAFSVALAFVILNLFIPFQLVKVNIGVVSVLEVIAFAVVPAYRYLRPFYYGHVLKKMWKDPLV